MTAKHDAKLTLSGNMYDITIDSVGDIATEDFFDTAILMSLFCERRANSSEVGQSWRRRGWIGNTDEFENGSKLWLSEQSRVTRTTLNAIETAVVNGLQWFIDDNIAINIDVTATLVNNVINLIVIIERPDSKVEKRYYELWNNTGI